MNINERLHASKTSSRWGSPRGGGGAALRITSSVNFLAVFCHTLGLPPASHASHTFGAFALATRTGLPRSTAQNPIFDPLPGKNDPHIRIPARFPGPDGLN